MVHISKEQLESWILDYGCKQKYHRVVKALAQRSVGHLNVFNIPHIRLVTCAFHRIITEGDIYNFDTAVEQLDFIYKSCPEVMPFKLYSKLVCGLKIKVLLDKLEKGDKYVLLKLNQYFPRTGTNFPADLSVTKKQLSAVRAVETNFRRFFLPLIANGNQKKAYFRDDYEDEYGDKFLCALKTLTRLFTEKIESHLPQTALEKILSSDLHKLCSQSDHSPDIVVETLLEVSYGKTELTEQNVLDLLTMLSPVCTQDKLQTDHLKFTQNTDTDSFSGRLGSESLFSSDNSDPHTRLNQSQNNSEESYSVTRNTMSETCTKVKDKISTSSKEVDKRQERGDNSRTDTVVIQSSGESLVSSEESVSLFAVQKTRENKNKKTENHKKTPLQQADLQKEESDCGDKEADVPSSDSHCANSAMETDEEQHLDTSNSDEMIPPSRMEDFNVNQCLEDRIYTPELENCNLPHIRISHPDVMPCIVKLHRKKDLDIQLEYSDFIYHIYC